jgi:signal transduction histidine kinase
MQKTLAPMLALLVAFAAGFSLDAWHTNKVDETRQLAALAELGAASLNSYLAKFEATLRLASAEMLRRSAAPGLPARIRDGVHEVYPELHNVRVVTLGEEKPNTGTGELARAVFPAPAAYASGQGGLVFDRPVWSKSANDWVIPIRYAMRDERGMLMYAIDASLPLSTAYNLWKDAPLPEGGRLGVMRDDGHLMTLYPVPDRLQRETIYGIVRTNSPVFLHVREHNFPQRGMVEGAGTWDGRPRLWVYRRLENYPLTLYTSLPTAFLWQTWWQQVRYPYLLLALGTLGGALVYGWIMRRQRAWEIAREKSDRRIRRLNRKLAQRVAQLEASNSELDAFGYTVSHDLRGPLRVIHGFSERLAEHCGTLLDAKSAHYLDRIKISARRMGDLVDGLLQLSRVARVKVDPQPVDLTHEAKSVARELQQLSPERNVRFSVEEDLLAHGSQPLLRDLLRNLLENAWKFTATRSEATISLTTEDRGRERAYVVRDNGVGFDMQYARKLFNAFHRLHGTDYDGVGIGLATAARIAAMHGGRIWAEARKNEGAAFYFVLQPRS